MTGAQGRICTLTSTVEIAMRRHDDSDRGPSAEEDRLMEIDFGFECLYRRSIWMMSCLASGQQYTAPVLPATRRLSRFSTP